MAIPAAGRDRLLNKQLIKNQNVAIDRLVCNSVLIAIRSKTVNQATSRRE
jgi:hypothetical protein